MTDLGRSLEHGDDAAGADHRRPGFAFSADHDLAFALGWPYVIRLVEDEDDPGEVALKLAKGKLVTCDWPRAATHRVLRALGAGMKGRGLAPEGAKGLTNPDEVSEDEALALLKAFFEQRFIKRLQPLIATFAFEAILGPETVLDTFLSSVETSPAAWLDQRAAIANLTVRQGYHLLRVRREVAPRYRERMEALLAAHAEAIGLNDRPPNRFPIRHLDIVLHGRAGAERSGEVVDGSIVPRHLGFVMDDSGFVLEQASALRPDPSSRVDARLAFLAGERWLEQEEQRWPKYKHPTPGIAHQQVVEQLGRIRSPKTSAIMLAMAAKSKAKKQAAAWFLEHADFARPHLEAELSGEHGAVATELLAKID
ncbi:MAG: hypothetical protein JJ863_03860 [Deltaproteobacteria bacterium]|nr:hypothetical protein [Deltaproteobacteria bacterium]